MVKKYARVLENREINSMTGEVWAIQDVPNTWRTKTQAKVVEDGYHFAEDGTAWPNEINEVGEEE